MACLQVAPSGDYFMREGKPFFYLGDTVWMAFCQVPLPQWAEYLHWRKMQGFTVLQIALFPVMHDTSALSGDMLPFHLNAEGHMDFTRINEGYFERAEQMLAMAVKEGFVPNLHLLWVNYIPDSWASRKMPESAIPKELLEPVYRYAVRRMKKFDPIYTITGDVNFSDPHVEEYAQALLRIVGEEDPGAVTSLHLAPDQVIPNGLVQNPCLTFYSYQSGHDFLPHDRPAGHAGDFLNYPVKRPIINTEPCYEGHRHNFREGRHTAFDVRMAAWCSLLSGAKAGIGYGAHGLWSFHRRGQAFNNAGYSGIPYDASVALRFEGAWDMGLIRYLFEHYGLAEIRPYDRVESAVPDTAAACLPDRSRIAVYLPYNAPLVIREDLRGYRAEMIVLDRRYTVYPDISFGETAQIPPHDFNSDVLYLFTREEG